MNARLRETSTPQHNGDLNAEVEADHDRMPRASAGAAQAYVALALAAVAVGALAVGALAVGRLAIGRARIRRLEIDELLVRRLRVIEELQGPPQSEADD